MKTISVETLDTRESFDVEIEEKTNPLDILEFLGMSRYELGREMEGGGIKVFREDEDIYGKVPGQDELILLPKANIDPPFNPEKDIKIVEAKNGRVHHISIKQGDTLEGILERLDLESGVLYKRNAPEATFSNMNDPFADLQEGEALTFFGPSAFPTLLKNHLKGGDQS